MIKSNLAVFAQDNKTSSVVVVDAYAQTGANSVADLKPNNTALLVTAGAEGSLLTSIKALSMHTSTATQASIFIRKATDEVDHRVLLSTVFISAQSVNTSTKLAEYTFAVASEDSPMRLEAGDEIYFGIAVAQASGVVAHATYTDF